MICKTLGLTTSCSSQHPSCVAGAIRRTLLDVVQFSARNGRRVLAATTMEQFVEDFLVYLRHERGQAENTALTYHGLLKRFVDWAAPDLVPIGLRLGSSLEERG